MEKVCALIKSKWIILSKLLFEGVRPAETSWKVVRHPMQSITCLRAISYLNSAGEF